MSTHHYQLLYAFSINQAIQCLHICVFNQVIQFKDLHKIDYSNHLYLQYELYFLLSKEEYFFSSVYIFCLHECNKLRRFIQRGSLLQDYYQDINARGTFSSSSERVLPTSSRQEEKSSAGDTGSSEDWRHQEFHASEPHVW